MGCRALDRRSYIRIIIQTSSFNNHSQKVDMKVVNRSVPIGLAASFPELLRGGPRPAD